jgi:hypothetical protein
LKTGAPIDGNAIREGTAAIHLGNYYLHRKLLFT